MDTRRFRSLKAKHTRASLRARRPRHGQICASAHVSLADRAILGHKARELATKHRVECWRAHESRKRQLVAPCVCALDATIRKLKYESHSASTTCEPASAGGQNIMRALTQATGKLRDDCSKQRMDHMRVCAVTRRGEVYKPWNGRAVTACTHTNTNTRKHIPKSSLVQFDRP